MPRPANAPLQLEVLSIKLLNLPASDYQVEVASDGIRLRRKGTREWHGPATWESILSAALRTTVRRNEAVAERGIPA